MLNSKPGRQRAPRARTRGAGPRMLAESGEAHRRTRASRMQASGHAYETPQTTHSPDGSVAPRAALFARRHAGTPARPCLRLPLVPTLLMALPPPSSSHSDVAPPSVRRGAQRHRPSCAHHSARARPVFQPQKGLPHDGAHDGARALCTLVHRRPFPPRRGRTNRRFDEDIQGMALGHGRAHLVRVLCRSATPSGQMPETLHGWKPLDA